MIENRMKKYLKRIYLIKGFSLVEVIIFAAITASLIFVVSSLTGNVANIENFVNQKLQSRSSLEQTFQMLVTEIRSAGPSSNGSYQIELASTSSLVFFSDIDQDGIFERVRYTLGTSTISKGFVEPIGNPLVYATSSEVMKDVMTDVIVSTSTSLFSYFDSAYTGSQASMASPIDVSKIRVVKMSVYVDINPGKTPKAVFFSDTVTIRNSRSN